MSFLRVAPGLLVVACLAAGTSSMPSPDLLGVKRVYILPMRSGFDQYLANELTRHGVVYVVTDPHRADAVLTDHLGDSFEQRMGELFPPPPPPKPTTESKGDVKPDAKDQRAAPAEENAADTRPISSGISGKGNVFLVDREARMVLWSDFRTPHSRQPKDMKSAADSVASDLKHALQPSDSGPK
jgi:hypothetical protein